MSPRRPTWPWAVLLAVLIALGLASAPGCQSWRFKPRHHEPALSVLDARPLARA